MAFLTKTRAFLNETGEVSIFIAGFVSSGIRPKYEMKEFFSQCYAIGYKSFGLIALTGFIMGLVLTMQLQPSLTNYGIDSQLPGMVGIAIIREIGPVITALIFAGKIGSTIGAELGSMKVTEQIDAMEVSGTNPLKYLVATRVVAATLMLPALTVLGDAISLFGAYIGVNIGSVTSLHLFFNEVFDSISFRDILPAFIKTFFFGFNIGVIGCYKGYHSNNGTRGVGSSANAAVVISSVLIFIIDLLAVQFTNMLKLT